MVNKDDEFLGIDKNSGFALRVIVLSLPAGIILFLFCLFGLLSIPMGIGSYICLLFFYTVFLMPMSLEIQQIKKYIRKLASGESEEILLQNLTEKETRDLTEAINSMHKFWVDKTEMLENRTLSDAAVLDTLPEPLLMVNKSGIIIGANRAVRQLFGRDLSNADIKTVIKDTRFLATLDKVLIQNSRHEDLRLTLNNLKDQPKFHINITILPWFAKGEVVVVVSFYDLHKMLQFEQMQQDFVANASHELRTPLSVISGFVETLQTTAKDDVRVRDKFLQVISDQTVYMSSLIEDLLSLSKIEMSSDKPVEDKVNINAIVREIKTALAIRIKENKLTVNTKFARLPQIIADERQIKQVLQNLMDNAVKYAVQDTNISVVTSKALTIPPHRYYEVAKGEAVVISISNRSVAIMPEDLERLTERFYRLQVHKDQNIKGTGLGLSIVAQIVKRHKGNIKVVSEGDMVTFTVYLPINSEA